MTQLTIAIVNWNTKDLLRECLSSTLAHLDGIDTEVIVVDNGSTDGSRDMVCNEFPQVRLIETGKNLGFAKANNIAYRRSNSKYFLLLNSDTVVKPGAFSAMIRFLETHPDAGAVGCKLLNGDGSLQRSCSPFPTPLTELFDALYLSKLFPKSRVFGGYAMSYWDFNSVREVDFAGGSCLMFTRDCLDTVGLLDEDFFMYSEEADLCYRVKKGGWKVYFTPEASIIHYGGQSARLNTRRTSVELYKSKHTFMRKNYGLIPAVEYRGVVAISSIVRMAAIVPRLVMSKNRVQERDRLSVQASLLHWAVRRA